MSSRSGRRSSSPVPSNMDLYAAPTPRSSSIARQTRRSSPQDVARRDLGESRRRSQSPTSSSPSASDLEEHSSHGDWLETRGNVRESNPDTERTQFLRTHTKLRTHSAPAAMSKNPRQQMQEYARMRNELLTKEQFQELVQKHLDEFSHDIDFLHHHLFVLSDYALDTRRDYHTDAIDHKLLDGARQAFELDRLLLTEYYFKQLVHHLNTGPVQNRTARNLHHALDSARIQVNHVVAADGLRHTCQTRIDWSCKGCYEHGEHLYEARNDGLHEEVLKLGLYRIDGPANDNTWNSKYYFAAFALKVVEMRKNLRHKSTQDALSSRMRRTVAIIVKLEEAFERVQPMRWKQAGDLYSNTVALYSNPAHFGKVEVDQVIDQIELGRDEAWIGEFEHHHGRVGGLAVPDVSYHPYTSSLGSVHEVEEPARWTPHVTDWFAGMDERRSPVVAPSRPNSAPPDIESRPVSPSPSHYHRSGAPSPSVRAPTPKSGRRNTSPSRVMEGLRRLCTSSTFPTTPRTSPPQSPTKQTTSQSPASSAEQAKRPPVARRPPLRQNDSAYASTSTSLPTVRRFRGRLDSFFQSTRSKKEDHDVHVSTYSRAASPTGPGPEPHDDIPRGRSSVTLEPNVRNPYVNASHSVAHSPVRRLRGRSASVHRRVVDDDGRV